MRIEKNPETYSVKVIDRIRYIRKEHIQLHKDHNEYEYFASDQGPLFGWRLLCPSTREFALMGDR